MNEIKLLLRIFLAPIIVLNGYIFLIFILKLHLLWPSIDIPIHFIGGASIAYSAWTFLDILREKNILQSILPLIKMLFIVGIVALAAVFWEFFEYFVGYVLDVSLFQSKYFDTIKDLAIGISGGIITSIYLLFIKKNK